MRWSEGQKMTASFLYMAYFHFENVGWGKTAYEKADLDLVQKQIVNRGFHIGEWDVSRFVHEFSDYIKLPEYEGSYREYGGKDRCSFLEKFTWMWEAVFRWCRKFFVSITDVSATSRIWNSLLGLTDGMLGAMPPRFRCQIPVSME
jgi:hypothetical protein